MAAAGQSTAAVKSSNMGNQSGSSPLIAPCHSGTCSGLGNTSPMW